VATRRMRRVIGAGVVVAIGLGGLAAAPSSGALRAPAHAVAITGVSQLGMSRPRILLRKADVAIVQARLDRSPYTTLYERMDAEIAAAPRPSAADQTDCGLSVNIGREEAKARAAKDLAFMYTVDRVWDPTAGTVAVPTDAQRQALGDLAREYLVDTCTTSRIHIDPDRDINTANELVQMATAYDTLAGGGYDFANSRPVITGNLERWTAQFYSDYQPALYFVTNNHVAKGAASIGVAAIALAGSRGMNEAELESWLDFATTNVEKVVRYTEGSGDGTYGEGPFYWRYASENVLPFARALNQVAGGRSWRTRDGRVVRDIWTAPWFTAIGRWELDMTRPDGTLVPFDDANVDDAYFFGALPSTSPDASAYAWRWSTTGAASAALAYESAGNVDLAADEIVTYDDRVPAAPPSGPPNRLKGAGGDLVFRSDWGRNAVAAFVQAEHAGSRGFGRAPGQPGVAFAAVHDHADPGAFQLDAYGERLLLDPGYVNYTWTQHGLLSNPSAHNMILVGPATDPESPGNPNSASTLPSSPLDAFTTTSDAPEPVDGEASVTDTIDRAGIAGATVTTAYGRSPSYTPPDPLRGPDYQELLTGDSAFVQRRFLFVDRRYLVIADAVGSVAPRTYRWPLHGNGGGAAGVTDPQPALEVGQRGFEPADAIPATPYQASGGSFTPTAAGGEWSRAFARVDSAMAFDTTTQPGIALSQGLYEQTHGQLGSDTVLSTSVTGTVVRAASVIYPTPSDTAPPTITRLAIAGVAVLRVDDPARDHHVLVVVRAPGGSELALPSSVTGMPVSVSTDAATAVVDVHGDGTPVTRYFEQGTHLTLGGASVPVARARAR
jgi:hypothetical protein